MTLRRNLVVGAVVLAAAAAQALVGAERTTSATEPDAGAGILVRFDRDADRADRAAVRQRAGADFEESLPLSGLQVVEPQPGRSAEEVVASLERSGDVLYAETDATRTITALPNDRHMDRLWGLHNTGQTVAGAAGTADADIDAPEAWDVTTGAAGITVAVVDTGVDYGHPDLAPNLWRNPGETGGGRETNGVDDDANGFVDDWRGWDWVDRDGAPTDPHGHGTHVAGTVGARGNDGAGVAGVAWQVGLLPLRVLDAAGSGKVSDLVGAYAYAGRKQIRIVNASLGGAQFSQAEYDAIRAAPETLFVVAAGNDGVDNEQTGSYPCNYALPNIVCVAATDQNDELAAFSNFGRTTVDLAAPGVNIASTWPGGSWAYMDGTSMATPHVAGAAGLVWAQAPGATVAQVRQALLSGVDPKTSLLSKTATGGRLNAFGAVGAVAGASVAPPPAPPSPAPFVPAPAPAAAPGAARDSAAPRVWVRTPRVQRLRTILRRGIRVRIRCSEACTVRHEVLVARKRLGVRSARGGVARAGSVVIRVRLTGSAQRRLRRAGSVRLVLRTRAVDAAGNARMVRRVIRVRRL
ncbi:MAG: serine protease [Thermoleophilaceae bacterium]|jgi:subtilisin family serine protease|nr:serine protease [Thermoleophilaceae bacterium]